MKRMALRGLVVAGCCIPVLMADAAQKMRPPLPKPKPAEIAAPEPEPPEPEPSEAEPDKEARPATVIPREKPAQLQKSEPEVSPKPEPKPDAAEAEEDDKPDPGEDFVMCRQELAALGAKFTVPEMPAAEGKCKVPNPVQISAIASPEGEVDFPGGPILNCIFAKRFTSWVSDIAGPVVEAQTGEALAAIATGPGYECRSRNGDATGKISEHAFGNAIDIASFKLASKESFSVANVIKTGNVESRWLMALRISACGYFTTVLGPGSNAAHAEHYHFDLGLHGRSGNYRICE
jgi:hypothetical protein